MQKILLIQPPIRDFYFTSKRTIPYGLLCIAACLRKAGFHVELADGLATGKSKIIDLPREMDYLAPYYGREDLSPFNTFHHYRHYGYSFEHLGKLAKESGAFIVGISSLFTAYSEEALETARSVKKFHPRCHLVMGGHHPTEMPEKVMADPAVDYLLRGEGEKSFPQLALALMEGRKPEQIDGVVYRKTNGELHIPSPALVANPDHFPAPALDLLNHKFYGRKKGNSAVIVASRGCPMKCSYCCVSAGNSTFRKRSVDSVFDEIETAVTKYGARFIDFEDENLTLDKKWFFQLMGKIRGNFGHLNLELRAMNGLFPPSLNGEMVLEMKKSGFKTLNLSLCTTAVKQLENFNRPDVRTSLEKAINHADTLGMESVSYIIAGAPEQKAEDSLNDLLYLAQLKTVAGVSTFYPAPGSRDFEKARSLNLIPASCALMRSSAIPVSHTTTRLETVTLQRLGRLINFMKRLKKTGSPIPHAQKLPATARLDLSDRIETGKVLLQAFLADGIIRGVDKNGTPYPHKTSAPLVESFLDRYRRPDFFIG